MKHPVGLFERLGHMHHTLDAAIGLDPCVVDLARISDKAKNNQILADDSIDFNPLCSQRIGEAVNLLLRRAAFHNNNHICFLPD